MKIRLILLALPLVSLLMPACGRRESSDPVPALTVNAPPSAGENSAGLEQPGPADLPPCPGLVSVGETRGDDQTGGAILFSSQAVPAVLEFYTAALAEVGWVMGSALTQGQDHHLQFSQGRQFLRFQIGPSAGPGNTRILLAWKQTSGDPESGDAYAPDFEEEEPDNIRESSVEW